MEVFRENLPIEVCADFEKLILSGSRALEFLASQGTTGLRNLVLSRQDSGCPLYGSGGGSCATEVFSSSRDGIYLSVSPSGLGVDQDACGCQRRSCSTHPPPAQDSSETYGWWWVGRVIVDWFCTGELLWCFSSCSEAVIDFFAFWPVWQEGEEL